MIVQEDTTYIWPSSKAIQPLSYIMEVVKDREKWNRTDPEVRSVWTEKRDQTSTPLKIGMWRTCIVVNWTLSWISIILTSTQTYEQYISWLSPKRARRPIM